ncbi:MAG: hypothetical protein J6N70_05145 [Oribacterium sp.]|nr:hypothetical protein [Oribacterium sp.]
MNKNIEINLNPLTDGFVDNYEKRNAVSADYHALIIATNGAFRLTDQEEVNDILERFKTCGGSIILGDADFVVMFNDNKAFDIDDGRFFVGSMLVMKIDGGKLVLLSDEDIVTVQELLDDRMTTLKSGDLQFSALVLS